MMTLSDSALPIYVPQPPIAHIQRRIQQITGARAIVVQRLIQTLGEDSVLERLRAIDVYALQQMGLTAKQAQALVASIDLGCRVHHAYSLRQQDQIDSPAAAFQVLQPLIGFSQVEQMVVMALNVQHRVLGVGMIAQGTMTECPVDVRVLLRTVLSYGATACMVAHNHPSGAVQPSEEDQVLTRSLVQATRIVDIELLDHLIVCAGECAIDPSGTLDVIAMSVGTTRSLALTIAWVTDHPHKRGDNHDRP